MCRRPVRLQPWSPASLTETGTVRRDGAQSPRRGGFDRLSLTAFVVSSMRFNPLGLALSIIPLLALAVPVSADSVRFRFAPVGAEGTMTQVAVGPDGAIGELRTGVGAVKAYPGAFRTNRMVAFRHPYTSQNVTVPMKLPENTPQVEHISDRIRFNYGSYYVEARFLPDGAVDVIYNSGFLRPLPP